MNKWFGIALTTVMLPVISGAKDWSLGDWLKVLEAKIRRTEDRYQSDRAAVAAVRGRKTEEAGGLYWKGRKTALTAEELSAFKASLALIDGGKVEDARTALTAFLTKYPAGALAEDAKKTLSLLAAPTESVATSPAGETTSTPRP
jgi:hypothetical protein